MYETLGVGIQTTALRTYETLSIGIQTTPLRTYKAFGIGLQLHHLKRKNFWMQVSNYIALIVRSLRCRF